MAWRDAKTAPGLQLLLKLAQLHQSLVALRAEQQVARATGQARMLLAGENRAEKRRELWAGTPGTPKKQR